MISAISYIFCYSLEFIELKLYFILTNAIVIQCQRRISAQNYSISFLWPHGVDIVCYRYEVKEKRFWATKNKRINLILVSPRGRAPCRLKHNQIVEYGFLEEKQLDQRVGHLKDNKKGWAVLGRNLPFTLTNASHRKSVVIIVGIVIFVLSF